MKKLLGKVEDYTPLVWAAASVCSAGLSVFTDDTLYMVCAMLAYLCAKAK